MNLHPKLDNPVWHSLTETHQAFSMNFGNVKFYQPDYCPFGAFATVCSDNTFGLESYSSLLTEFYIVGKKPDLSASLKLKNELVCLQMLINNRIDLEVKDKVVELNENHTAKLFELVNLVQPGYFKSRTHLLGKYFGIFSKNELVAVAGERMKMNGYVEISAIVTHPDFTGRGYARQLIKYLVDTIFNNNCAPFLHVAEANAGAISLYEKLGFETRRKISFWNILKEGN